MASHFRAMGVVLESKEEFTALMQRALVEGRWRPSSQGGYLRWTPGEGIELWGQLNADHKLLAANPHFVGESRVRLEVTRNPETNLPFWVLSVATYGATLDVVAAPEDVEGTPIVGGIARGEFYLSAHLIDTL